MAERIPDEAWVVRGGTCTPEMLATGMLKPHPSGIVGASVQCEVSLSLEELASVIPHGKVGVTTAAAVRGVGGDVVRTSGKHHHATVIGLTPEQLSKLLTPVVPNPSQVTKGGVP